ncbi:MAG: TIM-barrel domain-containing protein [Breznakiellaceae bacterium]
MHYRKIDTPENYVFSTSTPQELQVPSGGEAVRTIVRSPRYPEVYVKLKKLGPALYRYRGSSDRWKAETEKLVALTPFAQNEETPESANGSEKDHSLFFSEKTADGAETEALSCVLASDGGLSLLSGEQVVLRGLGLGLNGKRWMLRFAYNERHRYFGLGGKNLGFEVSGKRTLFWNTDLFAEFSWEEIEQSKADPLYASFPVLIGYDPDSGVWYAFVMDAPWPGFMNIGATEGIFGARPFTRYLYLGAHNGEPDVWILMDRRPDRLVQGIQQLQGTFSLPPLWALGHHQCRWGYRSAEDLERIAAEYEKRGIPNDGLWLDIDYMDGFRVFTVEKTHFPRGAEHIRALKERGYQVVPILDPGLRRDEAYGPYQEAKGKGLLCETKEGIPYTGFVWPGYTVFPDFSLEKTRSWWAQRVTDFTKTYGFSGYWIDMNDPATGSAPLEDMRFKQGKLKHEAFHNLYALGMAIATRQGLEAAYPEKRPFLISRSAFLGMARYSGMWTGDNVSNEIHLKASIPFSLNLSVSGMPFQGPDVPGFAGNASAALMEIWYKAGFLFPFLRNHNVHSAQDQEPWTRGPATERVTAEYIRSRYKLIPYLYQLWIEQEEIGSPVMRPLWYHYPEEEWTHFCDDQFLIGPSLLHAPLTSLTEKKRIVRLPKGKWFDWNRGQVITGGQELEVQPGRMETPLYIRCPAVLPLLPGQRTTNHKDLRTVEFLLCVQEGDTGVYRYRADDGETLEYRKGVYSELEIHYACAGGLVRLEVQPLQDSYGPVHYSFQFPSSLACRGVVLNGKEVPLHKNRLALAGKRLACYRVRGE